MTPLRSLVFLAIALCAFVGIGTANEPEPSCVVDVDAAISAAGGLKTTDVTPLAEGTWVGDVYVLPYTYPGTYDRHLPGGLDNVQARQWVAQSFFAHNPDAYDFVAVVTGFEFDAGWGQNGDPTHALYWGVRNDTAGIGLDFFDHAQLFGSHRLEGYIDANGLELVRNASGHLDADQLLTILSHELGHRWLAYCDYEDAPGSVSGALRGVEDTHWSYLLSSDASYMYGADWRDNDNGSFTATEIKARYSELDLYLMGMLNADEVAPFSLLHNPAVPPDQVPDLGATITASPTTVAVDQIIAAEGPRIPVADDAPHELRIALIYLAAPDSQPGAEELDFLAGARSNWQRRFFAQTEGRGVVGVGRNSLPVMSPPSIHLDAAIDWLLAAAGPAGLWADDPRTLGRDTASAIAALDAYGGHGGTVATALDSLAIASQASTEIEAWRAEPLARHQHPDSGPLLDQLSSWVLDEGAWGGGLRYAGDTVTTARVARSLAAGSRTSEANQALLWIAGRQNDDGGWSWRDGGPSASAPTLEAISAAMAVDPQSWNLGEVQDAITWLLGRRSQGGFGDPHPDIHQTAAFLLAARGQAVSQEIINGALAFLVTRQRTDGSWSGSVYDTALAVAALAPYVMPDLSVSPTEVLIEPDEPFNDEPLTLTAAVRALNGDVAAGISYRWEVIDASQNVITTLDGLLPHIPATLFTTVSDTWDLRHFVHPGTYTFRFIVDPLDELTEANEDNNVVEVQVTFRNHTGWIDLDLRPDSVLANPTVIGSLPQTVVIDGIVRNTGRSEARDAVIAVFETGDPTPLTSTTVTVPDNGEAPFQLIFQLDEARPYELAVIADPDNLLNDADPSNNRVDLSIGVDAVFDPAVVPGSLNIDPPSGIQAGDLVSVGFDLVNHGTEPLSSLQVGLSYTAGDPAVTIPIRLIEVSTPLAPGETRTESFDWRPPVADAAMRLSIEVDPFHSVSDVNRANNTAEITFTVAPSPLPNLVASHMGIDFDPEPALQHETVHISAAISNPTDNTAGAFSARVWIDEIGTGVLVGEAALAGLGPGEDTTIEFDWLVDEMADRLVWLEVDPDEQVVEFDEGDNRDFKVLDVQTIPDLVMTSGQVSLAPRFPRAGDVVVVEIAVANTGDQPANDVDVELALAGGATIGLATIPVIEGGGSEAVSFDWPTNGIVGDVILSITADPADAVIEIDENNNSVEIATAVQDEDLWVTERYISPNGDGVRDTTTIFVRETVTEIEIVDPWDEVVNVLTVEAPGLAVWDSTQTNGAAVRDGVYTLRAAGLVSWVEVDLNNVTITDDVRQTLIFGNVAPISTHPSAWISLSAMSPVDGVFYLTEWTGTERKIRRWSSEGLTSRTDWPDGHFTDIRGMSADERVFITWNGGYSLLQFPGPQIDPLPEPGLGGEPHISPDGQWILWVTKSTPIDRIIVLQRTDDLSQVVQFGPYLSGTGEGWNCEPTVHWAPGSSRAVVTLNHHISNWTGIGLALDIDMNGPPTVREIALEQACGAGSTHESLLGVAASVDMDNNILACTRDYQAKLYRMDLRTGSVVETIDLPIPGFNFYVWYRLSTDGRAVEVDEHVEEQKRNSTVDGHVLLDWKQGFSIPWVSAGYSYSNDGPGWSANARFVTTALGSGVSGHFPYLTPAANLAVTMDPVVRFGGAGIDLLLTVTDKNLDHYRLDYAPASDPEAFEALGQPSRDPLIGENWGTWIPPAQSAWKIRLTAVDLAGNERSVSRWVTWNGVSDIAGLWTESRFISPVASPGVKDQMVWQYTVLRPSQLLFEIVDETGAVLKVIPVGASQPGPRTTTWDGLDDAGRPVPDGSYKLVFRGAEWPVTVDNTPPDLSFEIADNGLRPTTDEIQTAANMDPPVELARSALFNDTSWSVADDHLERAAFESRHVDQVEWAPVGGPALFADVTESVSRESEIRSEWWSERIVRQVATDRAGNTSVAERIHREEQLAFAVAEPPCRNHDEPCLFPNRPDVNDLGDADGLMNETVAVLWPDYSTLLVQSTVWGDWRGALRLEFRTPGENGLPPGDWQPGAITTADAMLWRRPRVLSGNPTQSTTILGAKALPVYWEHPGLPLRPYEVRLAATNRDGDEFTSPTTLVVPKAPLAVEYLSTDAGGDHFRVHNIGTVRIDDINLFGSGDAVNWWQVAPIGTLDPGLSTLVSTGCGFLTAAVEGTLTNWIRVEGTDPFGAAQSSLPAPFQRLGPPVAVSRPGFSMVRGSCDPGSPAVMGMMGYNPGPGGPVECTTWSCELGWFTTGNLVDLQIQVPAVDPNGAPVGGYELLIDGNVVAGAPELVPGTNGRVILDLTDLPEGDHVVSERYLFAPGEQGMLSSCVESTVLHVDRSANVTITNPAPGQSLCPDQGLVPISIQPDAGAWSTELLIDGGLTGIGVDPTTGGPSISVPALEPGPHTLSASLVDLAGNAACDSVDFFTEGVAAAMDIAADPPVFSPTNAVGRPTETVVSFASSARANYVIEIRDEWDDTVVSSDGTVDPWETVSLVWDGTDGDTPVDDGVYGIWIQLVSDCGAVYVTPEPLKRVVVDTTGPTMVVTRPSAFEGVLTAIELRALMTDLHFEGWVGRIKSAAPPSTEWIVFASGDRQSTDPDNVLTRWPISNLPASAYDVEIEALDIAGNRTVSGVIFVVVQESQVIGSFNATPIYFSPNGGGRAEITEFSFELLQEADVYLGFEGWIDIIDLATFPPGEVHTAEWDGLDPDGVPAPDGAYEFTLGVPVGGPGGEEFDYATVIVDRAPPVVELTSPPNGTLTALPLTVTGFSSDIHADEHTISLAQPGGSVVELKAGVGNWSSGETLTLEDLTDGDYRVIVTATDLAQNSTTVEHDVTIDNTAPSAHITTPDAGRIIDPESNPLVFRGTVTAAHPDSYAWWIADGTSPGVGDFALLDEQSLATGGIVEHTWTGSPPTDGTHTIRLTTIDELGRTAEDRRVITIDGHDPVVEIWTPTEGVVITGPVIVTGLADDSNLSFWTLEEIANGATARLLATGVTPAQNELIEWEPPTEDGPATLRLTAQDAAGHTAEVSVNVDVAVQPPGAPVDLVAEVVYGGDVSLSWQPGPGPSPVGYHVDRDGVRITTVPVAQPSLVDPQLLDGVYTYSVTAIGPLGRESDPSAPLTVVVNLSPPAIALVSPSSGERISSEVAIHGMAFAADDFGFWELAARAFGAPDWIVLKTETAPVLGGFMANWNTHLAPWVDGPHELRLAAEDVVGNHAELVIPLIIDNTAPEPGPVNLQAVLVALDPDGLANDVQLSWVQTPTPPDLTGFYLYRNGLLANAPGPVVGDPSAYLLPGPDHDDRDVTDGTYTYGVAAADTAGNVSSLSNPAGPITIDVRRPQAVITSPADGAEIEVSVEIVAECEDEDVVALDLEYRLASQPDWTAIAPTFVAPPYSAVFTPPEHGQYFVRALAADAHGPDLSPQVIEITAADTPPGAPIQLTARVAGGNVTLTWIAPPDPGGDLAGYEVTRDGEVLTAQLLPPETLLYVDDDLRDGVYHYRVAAVDHAAQQTATDPVTARVASPYWNRIEPVTYSTIASLTGGGAQPHGSVEIQRLTPDEGLTTVAIIDAEADGVFVLDDTPLAYGANSFTALSSDDDGNTSRISLPLLVVSHHSPAKPENFTAAPDGGDITLSWTAEPDLESAGFRISRAGSVINESTLPLVFDPVAQNVNASSGDPATWQLPVDGDPVTGWAPDRVPSRGHPEQWSWAWPDPVELAEITVTWSATDPPQDFDVDVYTAGGWLWAATASWTGQQSTTIPIGLTALGIRIRLPETGSCGSAACLPVLTEVEVFSLERTVDYSYLDQGLPDGVHNYDIRQLNTWGQVSLSSSVAVSVGPLQPLPPTDPTVTPIDCGGLEIGWQPAAGQPGTLIDHWIYRNDQPSGPFVRIGSAGATQTSWTDIHAPVDEERFYRLTSRVNLGGAIVESQPSATAFGTAGCQSPPPPVITQPTVAGQPIQITPSQNPFQVRGTTISGSIITLLHDGIAIDSKPTGATFAFNPVHAHPGSNTFVARQELYGILTDSAPIVVGLDESFFPDLEAVSLTVLPRAAAPGEFAMFEATVELHGTAGESAAFDVAFDIEAPNGVASEIYRTSLFLEAGDRAVIRAPWTAETPAGLHTIRVMVDPGNTVIETDEDNNSVAATIRVIDGEGLEVDVEVDRSVYLVGQQLTGRVFFASSDPPADYVLETRLEDSGGQTAAILDTRTLTAFSDDWVEFGFDQPLIGLYPGFYRVRVAALVDGIPVAENLAPFQLEQPLFIEASVAADRTTYAEGAPVSIEGRIRNLGPAFVDRLVANLRIIDETTAQSIAHAVFPDIVIGAGSEAGINWSWSSGGVLPGPFRVELDVRDGSGILIATAGPFPFTVVPGDVRLGARIELSPSQAEPGNDVNAVLTVENTGPVDLTSLDLALKVIDPVALEIVAEHLHTISLDAGEIRVVEQPLDTTDLDLQRYVALVTASGNDGHAPFTIDLASATLEIADLSPPTVLTIEPSGGGVACEFIEIVAEVEDRFSRIARVWHHLDDETTAVPLHLHDPAANPHLWSATRPLPSGLDGPHTITVHAEDIRGNRNAGEEVAFNADTAPPVLQLSAPADGSCAAGETAIVFTAIDATLASLTALLDGEPYSSGTLISTEGTHLFEVTATDACGRQASEARTFTLDSTAPEIVVTGVAQGGQVAPGTALEWTVTDPNLTAVVATLDGQLVTSPVVLNVPGPHVFHIAAADCAANSSETTLDFSVVEAVLALNGSTSADPAVLEPGQALTVEGEIHNDGADLESVQLTLDVVETATSAVVASHTETVDLPSSQTHVLSFTPDTGGWVLGVHEIRFTARGHFLGQPFDLELGATTATLADLTAPHLVVLSPAPGLACDEIEVVAEATDNLTGISAVGVTVDGGATLPLINIGGSIWSASLVLDQGIHHLELIAADGAGNPTAPSVVDVDLDTEAPLLSVTGPDDDACIGEPTTIEFSADDPHLAEVSATLNGAPISTGHVVDVDGDHQLSVIAIDTCDRQTTNERQFTIDTATPEITIVGLDDGATYAIGTPAEWTATDDNLSSSAAILDGMPVDPSFTVDTVGAHVFVVTAEDCAGNTTEREISFETVLPEDGLTGSVITDPTQVEPPEAIRTTGSAINLITTDYTNLTLRLEIIDPATGVVLASHEATADLPSGATVDVEHVFATETLPLGAFDVAFSTAGMMHGNAFSVELGRTSFEVIDLTSPSLTLLSPEPGLTCEPVEVRATVTDALAGVESVRVYVDGDPNGLDLAHVGGDTWLLALSPSEGPHHLELIAADAAGNESAPVAVEIDLDLTAPVLVVAAPVNGECLAGPVTISFSAEDEHLEDLTALINGEPIVSGSILSMDGEYALSLTATDECGRTDTHTSLFIIDTIAPVVTISGVEDGGELSPPVEITWSIEDPNLTASTATLDGDPVASGIVVGQPGDHLLVIEAEDCAGNNRRTEIRFTLMEDPTPNLAVSHRIDGAGAILLLDRSPAGGSDLETWLAERAGRVTRVSDGCAFISELRRGLHELVVLYAPTGSSPLDISSCSYDPELTPLAAELSATSYRRDGILVLGEGMEGAGCLGCLLDAAGARFDDHTADQHQVEATTSIIETDGPITIYDLRPVDTDGGFPLLLGGGVGESICDGLRKVTLTFDAGLEGPWLAEVVVTTPHEALDIETGELNDGDILDEAAAAWVDLAIEREGGALAIELSTAQRGALPDWLGLTATVTTTDPGSGAQVETSSWIATECGLAPGQVFEHFVVANVEAIGHDTDQVVAATGRRYGRGEALVLPWDVLAPANEGARAALDQALEFSIPSEPWPAVTELPIPLSFILENRGNTTAVARLDVSASPLLLLEAWDDPLTLDPVRWETELAAGDAITKTLWIIPTAETNEIDIPWEMLIGLDGVWSNTDTGVIHIDVRIADRSLELRELRIAINDCVLATDDPVVVATLRDVLVAVDRVASFGDDHAAAEGALTELAAAFIAARDEAHPCLADLRRRLADLTALWQARWVSTGDQP